jgi:hypothetical protein
MRTRVLAILWLLMGIAVWSGMFDLYVARGADLYLWRQAQFQLQLTQTEPSMAAMMADAKRHGALMASIWAALVTGFGWVTIWLAKKT